MSNKQASYRTIIKSTSIFGGVQLIQIIISIIKVKFLAVLLGPTGMGISNLYLSSFNVISSVVGLGLAFSSVREISLALEANQLIKIYRIIKIVTRWLILSSVLGITFTIIFAPLLSEITFGSINYSGAFISLSIIIIFNALSTANNSILQGMLRIKNLASSKTLGSILGLITSIPIYYFYGVKGIIPVIILSSLITLVVSEYYKYQIERENALISIKETFYEGKNMVNLGVLMVFSTFISTLFTFIINSYISNNGSLETVGLYQAAQNMTIQYFSLIFSAMGLDFYPRLSASSNDNSKVRILVNEQTEILLLIIIPLLIMFLLVAPFMIKLTLSSNFISMTPLVRLITLGMAFKAMTFAVGYISFAKGDRKTYFIMEGLFGNFVTLILSIVLFHYWGLIGIGVSILLASIIYLFVITIVTKIKYNFQFSESVIRILLISIFFSSSTFLIVNFSTHKLSLISGITVFFFSAYYSIYHLNKKIGLKDFFLGKINKS